MDKSSCSMSASINSIYQLGLLFGSININCAAARPRPLLSAIARIVSTSLVVITPLVTKNGTKSDGQRY